MPGSLQRMVRPRDTHNLLLLTAAKSKEETSPTANKKDNWKCRSSNLPKISTGKQQWSKQRERNGANDYEDHREQYGFDHRKVCVVEWPNDKSSATRPAGRVDCKPWRHAGFAAAHG
jgi:hypothetical protein